MLRKHDRVGVLIHKFTGFNERWYGFQSAVPSCEFVILVKVISTRKTDEEIEREVELEIRSCRRIVSPYIRSYGTSHYEEYLTQLTYYEEELREYLQKVRALDAGWKLSFRLMLANIGAAPATNIEASIELSPGWTATLAKDFNNDSRGFGQLKRPNRPQVPNPPTPFSGMFDDRVTGDNFDWYLSATSHEESESPKVARTRAHGNVILLDHPKLRAKEKWQSSLIVALGPPITRNGIEWTSKSYLDEYPEPDKSVLRVLVDQQNV